MTSLSTVVLACVVAVAVAVIPPNYILKVTPVCGDQPDAVAKVVIRTDLFIQAQAECDDGVIVNFTSTDDVNWEVPVAYPGNSAANVRCIFKKKINMMAFNIDVHVAYGEKAGVVHMREERFLITCTFSPHGTEHSNEQNIADSLIAPPELLGLDGPASGSTVSLQLVDVLGNPLAGQNVHLGRIVQLKGTLNAKDGEQGLRPVSCLAMEGNRSYAILRGGCGDGVIFKQTDGFTTDGTSVLSPYFETFSLEFATVVQFRCSFVTCKDNCDGCSCKNEARKKRDISGYLESGTEFGAGETQVRSKTIRFFGVQAESVPGRK